MTTLCWKRKGLFLGLLLIFAMIACKKGDTVAGDSEHGRDIYRANCFSCHGVDPAHDGPLGPAIEGSSRELLTIRLEKGGKHYPEGYTPKRKTTVMPPQAHLVASIDDLLAYINMDHSGEGSQAVVAADPKAEKGRTIFLASCMGCHQVDGKGRVGLAPSLTNRDFLAVATDDFLRKTIKQGRAGTNMIAFAFLGDEKINEVIAYLRSFQQEKPVAYDEHWKASGGSAARGRPLYVGTCSQCHGINGRGYILGGSGTGIGLNGFLNTVSDGFIRQVLRTGREGTPMRSFEGPLGLAYLSERDMSDIIVYLRSLGKQNARSL